MLIIHTKMTRKVMNFKMRVHDWPKVSFSRHVDIWSISIWRCATFLVTADVVYQWVKCATMRIQADKRRKTGDLAWSLGVLHSSEQCSRMGNNLRTSCYYTYIVIYTLHIFIISKIHSWHSFWKKVSYNYGHVENISHPSNHRCIPAGAHGNDALPLQVWK